VGLILGPPAPGRGRARRIPPPSAGSTARSGGHWAVQTSVVAHLLGPQAAGPAHRARNDPPGGVASRTSLLPSCADTPRIRRDEGRKPTGRGGLGQGGRQPIRLGNRGVLPLATMIASVNCPRRLAEHVTKHPPARNHPTCDCCHDPLHRQRLLRSPCPQAGSSCGRIPGRALVPMSGRSPLTGRRWRRSRGGRCEPSSPGRGRPSNPSAAPGAMVWRGNSPAGRAGSSGWPG